MRIAIVGAGPAGLAAAQKLAEAGKTTVVFEKSHEIGSPVRCGEGLIDLHHFYDKDPPGARMKVTEIRVGLGKLHTVSLGDVNVWVLDKDVWLKSMSSEVESLGGEILTETHVNLSDLRKEFDFVLDCSGCPSQSMREYGVKYGTLGLAVQYRVRANLREFVGKLYFEYSSERVGGRWIFPKSSDEGNVGVGWVHDAPKGKWDYLDRFASRHLGEYNIESRTTGCIPLQVATKLKIENILLCGDAAGLANPYHAGGIHNALLSGELAARSLLEGKPELYEKRLRSSTRAELRIARFLRSLLEHSFRHHEKLVSYMEPRFSLGQAFSDTAYSKLLPFIQIWKLRCLVLDRRSPSI